VVLKTWLSWQTALPVSNDYCCLVCSLAALLGLAGTADADPAALITCCTVQLLATP
jgi:hypothetical protein